VVAPRWLFALGLLAGCQAAAPAPPAAPPAIPPAAPGDVAYALRCAKILTCNAKDEIVNHGLVLVRNGKIEYVGKPIEVPAGFEELGPEGAWAAPGFVDLHSHIVGPGFDINDMVDPVNPELSTRPSITAGNDMIRTATAGGVTTMFLIPGSGTSISGFGVLFKGKTESSYEDSVLRDPGGMKSAYNFNPQRGGGDVGRTWSGLTWLTRDIVDKAAAAREQGRDDWELANLERVLAGELPVLIHCASGEGVAGVVRVWKKEYDTHCILSHGDWTGTRWRSSWPTTTCRSTTARASWSTAAPAPGGWSAPRTSSSRRACRSSRSTPTRPSCRRRSSSSRARCPPDWGPTPTRCCSP
jgi:hypothetical protein